MNKTVVITIETEANQAIQEIVKLRKENEELVAAKKSLDVTTDDGRKKLEAYNAVIAANNQQIRGLTSATTAMARGTDEAAGSINQMAAEITQLSKKYNALSATERESAAGKQLQKDLKEKRDNFNELKKATGDYTSNIGRYSESFKEAAKDLQLFGVNVGQMAGQVGGVKNAFMAAGGGVKGFSAALATTGIPIVIMALQSLFSLLENFKPLMDWFEQTAAGIGAAFNSIFSGGDIAKAYDQATKIKAAQQDFEDMQYTVDANQIKRQNEIDRLLIQAKNKTLNFEERKSILEKAAKLEKENFEERRKRAQEDFDLSVKALMNSKQLNQEEVAALIYRDTAKRKAMAENLERQKMISDSDLKNIADKRKALLQMEGETLAVQERINNRSEQLDQARLQKQQENEAKRKALAEKAAAAEAKRREEGRKAEEAYDKMLADKAQARLNIEYQIEDIRISLIEDQTERELQALKVAEARKLAAIKGNSDKEIELKQALSDQSFEQLMDILEKEMAASDAADKQQAQKELAALRKLNEDKLKILEAAIIETINANQSSYEAELALLDERYAQEIAAAKDNDAQKRLIDARYARDKEALNDRIVKNIAQNARMEIQEINQLTNGISNVLGGLSKLVGDQTQAGKDLAYAAAIINAFSAASAAFSSTMEIPFIGPFLAPIQAGIALATGLKQAEAIANTPIPKYADGGLMVGGNLHSDGGTKFFGSDGSVFEAERGEVITVVNRRDAPRLNYLNSINSISGKPFSNRSYLADGGYAVSSSTSTSAAMAAQRAMFRNWQPVVKVSDINSVQNTVQQVGVITSL